MSFKLKFSTLCVAAASLGIFSIPANATESLNFGSIAFVGDSITQGGGTADELSYRYSLWKCFVDNNIKWDPVGSTTIFRYTTGSLPTYMGTTFDNRNEGHYGWRTSWVLDGVSGNAQTNSGTGKLSEWLENKEYYPEGYADTMTLMLAVNDLSDGTSISSVAANAKQIVQTYQTANENVKSYVFSILPTNQTWQGQASSTKITSYNDLIKSEIEAGEWGENVVYCDVTSGFDSSVHTKSDNVHPNAQGALIVAGNIARALGVGGATVGQERRASSTLGAQTSFASNDTTGISVTLNTQGEVATMNSVNTSERWSINDAGNILIKSHGNTASDLRYQYSTATEPHEFTLEVEFRMNDVTSNQTNRLGIWCGNGETVGLVYVEENALFWNNTVLYRNTDLSNLFVDDFSLLRMVWLGEDTENGIASGYYVWLDGMLVGEALSGTTLDAYKNGIVIGNTAAAYDTFAEISDISFDAQKAYAPSIPEPSMFGLLAGLGALALVGTRRRRK